MSDVFVSYTHNDNLEFDAEKKGWVSRFHLVLLNYLTSKLGRTAKVWRDAKLEGNDAFWDVIFKALAEAQTLVAVVSPRYVQSKSCVKEVVEFNRHWQAAGGVKVGDKPRLVRILTEPVKLPELIDGKPVPPELRELFKLSTGVEFYEVDPESGRSRQLRSEFGAKYDAKFNLLVDDVALMLANLLKADVKPAAPPSGKTVYLAQTCHDLKAERDRIERELRQRGHDVLPEGPLPLATADACETTIREALGRSQLAVHLVGRGYGLVPEDGTKSVVEIQNQLAAERSREAGFRRLIWTPRDETPKDPRLAAFLEQLTRDAEAQRGAEFAQDTIDELKDLLLELLTPPPAPSPPPTAASSAGKPAPRVYVICDPLDDERTAPLEDFLFQQGLEVSRPQFDGGAAEIAEAHRFNLSRCDAALIYYGQPSKLWLEMKLQDLEKAPGYGRTAPLRAAAVCVAPPDNRDKQRFQTRQAAVLRLGESFSPAPLQPFMEQLLKAGN
uniref:TIR domain-containing protein n=1 Tax=uncultured prokaryote EC6 TaxID=672204 RepID=D3W8K3_9ZZZZ|nr:hypothetical protein [uncultured prokaryote EC6]